MVGESHQEARHLGTIDVVGSSKESNYACIPAYAARALTRATCITPRTTPFSAQFSGTPEAGVRSCRHEFGHFLCTFDANPFHLIYAGAQKNMGPAGTVMYAFDREAMGHTANHSVLPRFDGQ